MKLEELKAKWDASADKFNQWSELGLDEIVDFSQAAEREECAKTCEGEMVEEDPEGDEAEEYNNALREAAAAIRARK